eukprot:116111-Prymnesium_polylepis.1
MAGRTVRSDGEKPRVLRRQLWVSTTTRPDQRRRLSRASVRALTCVLASASRPTALEDAGSSQPPRALFHVVY